MNYLKIIKAPERKLEEVLNAFLNEVDEKENRVMNMKFFTKGGRSTVYVLVNTKPHPRSTRDRPVVS